MSVAGAVISYKLKQVKFHITPYLLYDAGFVVNGVENEKKKTSFSLF